MPFNILVWVAVAFVFIGILSQILKVLREYERGVIFRIGRIHAVKGPGLIILLPVIDRMEKAGLVVRKPVPDDRRYNVIELTPHGLEMYHKVSGIYKKKIGDIMHVLDDEELKALKDILEKLRINLDRVRVE